MNHGALMYAPQRPTKKYRTSMRMGHRPVHWGLLFGRANYFTALGQSSDHEQRADPENADHRNNGICLPIGCQRISPACRFAAANNKKQPQPLTTRQFQKSQSLKHLSWVTLPGRALYDAHQGRKTRPLAALRLPVRVSHPRSGFLSCASGAAG